VDEQAGLSGGQQIEDMSVMRKFLLVAMLAFAVIAPASAHAGDLGTVTAGAVIGGLAGSVYATGLNATAAAVGSAAASTASAIGAAAPVVAAGVAGAVTAASAPVLVGVVVGGAVAYLLF
jgi:hypothetical protein